MAKQTKSILVLSRRDPLEAMRVAAGLTIFGHTVRLVFTGQPLSQEVMESDAAELLELAEIEPETTIKEMGEWLDVLDSARLAKAMSACDEVINI